jgi:cobalt-zinc-cadmium efflux system protein
MAQFFDMNKFMNEHAHHRHAHPHAHAPDAYNRAFVIGIALNSAFVVAEITCGLMANSLALLADAGHNASDVLGLFLAWGAVMLSRRHASERFTYGLQSASILAALANALLLMFALGGIGLEAVQRLYTPTSPATTMVMVVAAVGVVINGITAWLFHAGSQHDLNIRGAFLHMAADAGISLGVVMSALMIAQTGWLWLDPVTSLVIVAIIIASTWKLLKDAIRLALQAVPEQVDLSLVRAHLAQLPGVQGVHDLHVWAISTSEIALSAHLLMPAGHPGDAFIHRVGHELASRFHIGHATIQIEVGDAEDTCHSDCGHDHSH